MWTIFKCGGVFKIPIMRLIAQIHLDVHSPFKTLQWSCDLAASPSASDGNPFMENTTTIIRQDLF